MPLALARATAQPHASDARLLRAVAQAAPPVVVRLARILRRRGTVGKASASEARGNGFEPPWLFQWSRWESRPLTLVGYGVGAVTHPIDREGPGSVFPRETGHSSLKGVHIASFRCLSEERHILLEVRLVVRPAAMLRVLPVLCPRLPCARGSSVKRRQKAGNKRGISGQMISEKMIYSCTTL